MTAAAPITENATFADADSARSGARLSPVLRNLIEQVAAPSECFNTLVRYAAHLEAGDLYFSAQREGYWVTLRCDGMLERLGCVPRTWGERVIGYGKVEARLDPAEHRRPQDGRLMVLDDGHPIDVRVSSMPTFFGEDLALRILDRRNQLFAVSGLGLTPRDRNAILSLIRQPHGLILVSGSTGSGKTTTLYALLSELNDGSRKINTLEDPLEFDLAGVNQTQINPRIGLEFADLLPAALRQDPDVIMIGEVRDPQTATIAVRAAVTGQLVLATLHAAKASGAIHSMLGLGANPHLLAGALRGVIAQQLMRRICPACSERLDETDRLSTFDDVRDMFPDDAAPPLLHQGRGCDECRRTGYRRRIALFEILLCTRSISRMVEREATPDEIEQQAIADGLLPFRSSAKLAVGQGITTLEEAMRVMDLQG
ncbi:MAG: type II/IV secretion system protein [Planctomycetes bacterium]|nr:type II/IV secretion system protein [Planctomycetota bacterium]